MDSAGPDATTNMPFGWTNSQTDNPGDGSYPDWIARNTPSTPSGGTGPQNGDHTSGSGFYVHVEDSGGAGDSHSNIALVSPCIDLTSLSNPQLRFWLCSFNAGTAAQENRLDIDIIDWSSGIPVVIQLTNFSDNSAGCVIDDASDVEIRSSDALIRITCTAHACRDW